MEKAEARVILGIVMEASASEVEQAYRRRVGELRRRFEASRNRSLRAQYRREFAVIGEARQSLLFESEISENGVTDSSQYQLAEEPGVAELVTEDPAVEKPAVEELSLEESAIEEPGAEESVAVESGVEEPAIEGRAVEESVIEEPAVAEPTAEEPVVNESVVEEPAEEESVAVEPAAEVPAVREVASALDANDSAESAGATVNPSNGLESESAKDRVQTPQGASEMPKRLENANSHPAIPPAPPSERMFTPVEPPPAPIVSSLTRRPWLVIAGIGFILALVLVTIFFSLRPVAEPEQGKLAKESSPEPTAQPSPSGSAEQVSPSPIATASPEVSTTASPNASATSNEVIPSPTPLSQNEIDVPNDDVVKRIYAIPQFTTGQKKILIEKMQKARSTERLIVIPFDFGQTVLRKGAAENLVKSFETREMRDKLSDETTILVVAGYADTAGGTDINLRISRQRAENVAKALKQRAKLHNAIQTIGMGETDLLNSRRPDQNRVVEIWAITPF
jgi:outer membrane protein OmpA-like peptidoglycan-associated protein